MKKALIFFVALCFLCLNSYAQKHYVIALDCTKSMDHPNAFYDNDYSADARDVSKIWEPAKNTVKDIFNTASSNDRFTIILFQDRVLDCVDADKSQLTWSSINARMEAAIKNPHNTCVLSAWERAEKYFSNSSNAVFYLITDGVEDHGQGNNETARIHTEQLCEKIKTFCANYANTEGFYTNLVKSLHDKDNNAITKALEASPCFRTKVGGRFDDRLVVDIDENKGNYSQAVSLTFHPTDEVPANLNNICISSDDRYFEIAPVSGKIENNRFDVKVSCKDPYDRLGDAYTFKIKIFSDSSEKHQIYDQTIAVTANFKLSRVAFLPKVPLKGESVYQKPFKLLEDVFPKIAAEKKPTVIKFDLNQLVNEASLFNDEARRVGSEVYLRLKDRKNKPLPLVSLKYNGKSSGDVFVVRSSDKEAILEVEFDRNADAKKYRSLYLVIDDIKNVDRINSLVDCYDYTLDLELTYKVKENPWYVTALLLVILVALLILTWIIIANFPTRKMFGQLIPEGSYPITIQGRVRCVMTSKSQSQSLLSSLFKGPIVYSTPDSFWTSELQITRGRKFNIINVQPSKDFMIDGMVRTSPYAVHKGTSFKVESIHTNSKTTINYL